MRRFIRHFVCFPNRGFIAEYDLGGTICVIRCWLTPDGEYEVYHTDWDYGQRKDKPWLIFVDGKLHRTDTNEPVDWRDYSRDYNPDSKRSRYNRLRMIASMGREKKQSDEGFRFPAKIASLAPSHLDLQPEDVILNRPPSDEQMQKARDFLKTMQQAQETEEG